MPPWARAPAAQAAQVRVARRESDEERHQREDEICERQAGADLPERKCVGRDNISPRTLNESSHFARLNRPSGIELVKNVRHLQCDRDD